MKKAKVVVWDAVGNVLWGVRRWQDWDPRIQQALLQEDPEARAHAVDLSELFRQHPIELTLVKSLAELESNLAEAEFLLLHKVSVPAQALSAGRKLRLVEHLGLDYRGVPVRSARQLGIPVAAVPLINYLAVAEHAWALILSHLKQLPAVRAHMDRGQFQQSWGLFPGVLLVRDLTLGLLGLGEIGRVMASIARSFDMRVIYWDQGRLPAVEAECAAQYRDWETVFHEADVISVHLALNGDTEGIIGARELAWMKPSALVVNTARGRLIQQAALTEALVKRGIGGVALDVYEQEPLPADDPLLELQRRWPERVTLTPHCAWQSPWTWVRDSRAMWDNVLNVLRGEPVRYLVSGVGE